MDAKFKSKTNLFNMFFLIFDLLKIFFKKCTKKVKQNKFDEHE